MTIRVMLFAGLREKIGASSFELLMPERATVADVLAGLKAAYPNAAGLLAASAAAVDHEYASNETHLHNGAEIAVMPPVSGG